MITHVAESLCEETRAIYRVEQALGHAHFEVTKGYLRSLGLVS
jgi:hypothetical protein